MGGFVVRCAAEVFGRRRVRGVIRALLSVNRALITVGVGLTPFCCGSALAQDDFFKPVIEASPTPKHEGPPPIFSFARLEPQFGALCKGLEQDGRRERIVSIAEAGVAREKVCITCRSFWKMVASSCAKLGPRPTPTPKPPKKKRGQPTDEQVEAATPVEEQAEVSSAAESSGESQEAIATPTASPAAATRETRYPSTEVLDDASRMSSSFYALDSGEGQVSEMVRYFAKTVRGTSELSAKEREYYDILLTYLLAAWDGRVDSTKLPPPTVGPEVDSFFE
jgi:hypothetical protein